MRTKLDDAPSIIPPAAPKAKSSAKTEAKANLTDAYVEAVADFQDGQTKILIDFNFGKRGEKPSAPGLRARVGKHRVTWIYRYDDRRNKVPLNANGKRRQITMKRLGYFPEMTTEQAREAARIEAGKIAAGIATPGKKAQTKFKEAFADYIVHLKEKAADEGKPPRWAKNVTALGKIMLRDFGEWTLHDLSRDDGRKAVRDWHKKLKAAHPTTANHCARVMRALYRRAAKQDDTLSGDPTKYPTALCQIRDNGARLREQAVPAMSFRDFPVWLEAWCKLSPMRRAYNLANLLCGARGGELARTPWSNLDCRTRTLTIGASKTGIDIPIPLSAPLARALKMARDAGDGKSELIFPGCEYARDDLPARGHDYRHIYKTVATDCGVSEELSAFLLGHVPFGQSQKYIVRKMLLEGPNMRRKQRQISRRMLELLGSDPSLNVTLHHYTHPNNFPSIMRDGLVLSDWRKRDGSMDQACVWFFDTPEPRDYMDDRFRRLTVSVRRDQVINYIDYCRDHPGVTPVVSEAEARHIWLSFVTILPQQITIAPEHVAT